ncbi:hypothetical protein AQUCO_00600132v1 [Aquilegia coerulea]|uniref:Glycosyltransferase n=1 Tax=Aquilegia coerulea TaxID=218851 RepID=A0A2G5EN56_AQUCA|nr:hypothetical protein AQUCO_00600132v1 [Aquilegia coerulea]
METFLDAKKPHAVCIPLPYQSHINSMLKLAKILHFKGFHITFVNTEFNHQQLLISRGSDSLKCLPDDFQFKTIPDCRPPADVTNGLALLETITSNGLFLVRNLIAELNEVALKSSANPAVSCIVADSIMSCTLDAAEELGIPRVILWPMSASCLMTYLHHQIIFDKLALAAKDKSYLTNEYLDTPMGFIPGLRDMRLKDLPSFFWDGNADLQSLLSQEVQKASKASAVIISTFDALESEVLDAMKPLLPPIYTLGPLQLFEEQIPNEHLRSFGTNLYKENIDCLQWLDSKEPNSVVYVSFGSSTIMSKEQVIEFAWGLANCNHPFLWIIKPDLVYGEDVILPPEFKEETADRSMILDWCPQEKVLCHPSIGGFLTHSGWGSTMDTIRGGVPIISLPFIADNSTNCWKACVHWGIGMEIDKNVKRDDDVEGPVRELVEIEKGRGINKVARNVKRDEIEGLVRELMEGEKGKGMKNKAMEWKTSAEKATKPGGSSYVNLENVVKDVLLQT